MKTMNIPAPIGMIVEDDVWKKHNTTHNIPMPKKYNKVHLEI